MSTREFTEEEARAIGERVRDDWSGGDVDIEQFRMGLAVELEHGSHDPASDVTHDDAAPPGSSLQLPPSFPPLAGIHV